VELRVASSELREEQKIRNSKLEIHNSISKIRDGDHIWHRIGDVGYLDDQGRFWYCGRKSHRVKTGSSTLYTECCEAVFNVHPDIHRTALVGVGLCSGQTPVIVYEPLTANVDHDSVSRQLREIAGRFPHTREIRHFVRFSPFLVDVRHNAKINREQLAVVATQTLQRRPD
jgi:acyl-CoA synthetase (AMP-forming)/AMP-acid ligase II